MTIKCQTHKGQGFSELRFEDEAGREGVWMHALKDHNTVIENDETYQIVHDRAKRMGNDPSLSIGHDARHTVGNTMFCDVGRNRLENFGKDPIHNIGDIHKQDIFADHLAMAGRHCECRVSGELKLNAGATLTTNADKVHKHKMMAGATFEISSPKGKITIDELGTTLEAPKIDPKGGLPMGGSGSARAPALGLRANDALPLAAKVGP